MAGIAIPQDVERSRQFFASLFEGIDGERFKTCLQCATCSGACPFGYLMEFPPGKMISYLRADIFDEVLGSDSAWLCVSCYACSEICPLQIPITPGLMTRTKEELLLAGNIPTELQRALEFSQRYGNPMGESPRKRAGWVDSLDFEVPILRKAKRPVEVLWFVGDFASYHPRVQGITRAFAQLMNRLGVDFGILGPEENSDGDSQRLAGERGLFEMLAEKNGKAFRSYEFNEILTTDPHAYNAIKNEYPQLDIEYPVRHYTEFLAERIVEIRPLLTNKGDKRVAFHDPCYLGRTNGIYDAPRVLLEAIPGVKIVEMSHCKSNSLCCGGGGGGMWLDGFQWEKGGVRLSDWRVTEAVEAEAEVLAVSCPYEPPRFEDSTKTVPGADQIIVRDILELLIDALE